MHLFIDLALFVKEWWPLVTFFVGAIYAGYQGVRTINDTLVDIKHELKVSNDRISEFKEQLIKVWSELDKHDARLDNLATESVRHNENIKTLFKGGKGGE
ncbi:MULTISPECIES: hypothetical protein [Aerococcus]|uniref:Uncharacterized protein n=1 Tax=Aerococcus tenax TaxID=3078812 RepID=A0A329N5Y8_9LACT|nr:MULTISPECIES: hypothetical protein [Aerococcus]MDL5184728.1 hypothetical protein [Aerococcus mictus]KAA9239981.1 hypothetical protein F6I34_05650 [Aerococcus urinae]MDK6372004.1 hypothetical protein [Aerococcus urinae]MDK7302444.1 hypothetical protein [Aerococcus urinae]MDK7802303.1 hypothetical protein [Aerococcus urinae]